MFFKTIEYSDFNFMESIAFERKTSMLWTSQNFLLHKSTIISLIFHIRFLRFHSIEAKVRLSRVFKKNKIVASSLSYMHIYAYMHLLSDFHQKLIDFNLC